MTESLSINSTFYLSLATMSFAFLSGALAYTIKSKCSSVDMCCLRIVRDTSGELREDELELEKRDGGQVKV